MKHSATYATKRGENPFIFDDLDLFTSTSTSKMKSPALGSFMRSSSLIPKKSQQSLIMEYDSLRERRNAEETRSESRIRKNVDPDGSLLKLNKEIIKLQAITIDAQRRVLDAESEIINFQAQLDESEALHEKKIQEIKTKIELTNTRGADVVKLKAQLCEIKKKHKKEIEELKTNLLASETAYSQKQKDLRQQTEALYAKVAKEVEWRVEQSQLKLSQKFQEKEDKLVQQYNAKEADIVSQSEHQVRKKIQELAANAAQDKEIFTLQISSAEQEINNRKHLLQTKEERLQQVRQGLEERDRLIQNKEGQILVRIQEIEDSKLKIDQELSRVRDEGGVYTGRVKRLDNRQNVIEIQEKVLKEAKISLKEDTDRMQSTLKAERQELDRQRTEFEVASLQAEEVLRNFEVDKNALEEAKKDVGERTEAVDRRDVELTEALEEVQTEIEHREAQLALEKKDMEENKQELEKEELYQIERRKELEQWSAEIKIHEDKLLSREDDIHAREEHLNKYLAGFG